MVIVRIVDRCWILNRDGIMETNDLFRTRGYFSGKWSLGKIRIPACCIYGVDKLPVAQHSRHVRSAGAASEISRCDNLRFSIGSKALLKYGPPYVVMKKVRVYFMQAVVRL